MKSVIQEVLNILLFIPIIYLGNFMESLTNKPCVAGAVLQATLWLFNSLRHSLRLNAEVVARAWQILDYLVVGVKIILQVSYFFFMCLVRNLQKKMKKCPKSIQLWLCIRYCTDRLKLGHAQLFDQFLEVKLKHLEAR